jgi:hypothetical protein
MKPLGFLGFAGAMLISAPKNSVTQTAPAKIFRIVVANRYHGADGLMAVFCNQIARKGGMAEAAPFIYSISILSL